MFDAFAATLNCTGPVANDGAVHSTVHRLAPVSYTRAGKLVLDKGQRLVDGARDQLDARVQRLPRPGLAPLLLPGRKPCRDLELT